MPLNGHMPNIWHILVGHILALVDKTLRLGVSALNYFRGKSGQFSRCRLVANSDCLHLEMSAAENCAGANEGAGRKVLGELRPVGGIEFVEEGEIGAENLHENEVVHAHASG